MGILSVTMLHGELPMSPPFPLNRQTPEKVDCCFFPQFHHPVADLRLQQPLSMQLDLEH